MQTAKTFKWSSGGFRETMEVERDEREADGQELSDVDRLLFELRNEAIANGDSPEKADLALACAAVTMDIAETLIQSGFDASKATKIALNMVLTAME